jgi:hypothetical protein
VDSSHKGTRTPMGRTRAWLHVTIDPRTRPGARMRNHLEKGRRSMDSVDTAHHAHQLFSIFAGPGLFGLLAGLFLVVSGTRRRRLWTEAAQALDLESKDGGLLDKPVLTGRLEGLEVRIEKRHVPQARVTLAITEGPALPRGLWITLRSERPSSSLPEEVTTGDEEFDAEVRVCASPQDVLPLFDPLARAEILKAMRTGLVQVANGALVGPPTLRCGRAELVLAARALARVGRALSRTPGPQATISLWQQRARHGQPAERLQCLELLREQHPNSPETLRALRAALYDPSAEIRRYATRALGSDARIYLEAKVLEGAGPEQRGAAFQALFDHVPPAEMAQFAEALLHDQDPDVRHAAIELTSSERHRPAAGRLIELLGHDESDTVALAAEALGHIGDPVAEPELLTLLGSLDPGATLAAVEALGRIGTARAVEPLHGFEGMAVTASDRAVRRAAREAIASIQARLGLASPGGLSIAEPCGAAGALSVAAESGRLSPPQSAASEPGTQSAEAAP